MCSLVINRILPFVQRMQYVARNVITSCVKTHIVRIRFRSKDRTARPINMAFNKVTYSDSDVEEPYPPIVIMHGLFGSKTNWQSLSRTICLNAKRDVFAVDARNHGSSPHSQEFSYDHLADDIKMFVETHNLGKVSLLGHSMGGRAVMFFSLKFEPLVDKVIVVDTSPISNSSHLHGLQKMFTAMKSVRLNDSLSPSEGRKEADRQLASIIHHPSTRSFILTNLYKSNTGAFNWRINLDVLENSFVDSMVKFKLPEAQCHRPTLFIGGLQSDHLPQKDEPGILKYFPHCQFVYLDTGHLVHAENPTEFASVVTRFLLYTNYE